MPAGQSAQILPVPDRGDPDRKRALNVLAQRRYRQRRREKVIALQRQVQATASSKKNDSNSISEFHLSPPREITRVSSAEKNFPAQLEKDCSSPQSLETSNGSVLVDDDVEIMWNEFINPSLDISIMTPPSATSTDSSGSGRSGLPSSLPPPLAEFGSALFPPSSQSPDFSAELQDLTSSQYVFADDSSLAVPQLKVMRAGLEIAQLLGCAHSIFDFSARGVVNCSSTFLLPPSFTPTPAQLKIPHHPVLDLLPWPEVRTRLIVVFSQPESLRPPSASDPMALANLLYDMDDSSEGLRVEGEDGLDGDNWEVGQQFFRNWWWALDRSVVQNSNRLRAKRGAARLLLQ